MLQDIEKGNHDDEKCKEYCNDYKGKFGQELPNCQFKGNKSKIQDLIRKVHIDSDGNVFEVQFSDETTFDEDFQIAIAENQEMTNPNVEQDLNEFQFDTFLAIFCVLLFVAYFSNSWLLFSVAIMDLFYIVLVSNLLK